MRTIPSLALELKMNYFELMQNTLRIASLSQFQRERILQGADKELPRNLKLKALPLVRALAEEREVYELLGIPYSQGPPQGKKIFITTLADYLLRNLDQVANSYSIQSSR